MFFLTFNVIFITDKNIIIKMNRFLVNSPKFQYGFNTNFYNGHVQIVQYESTHKPIDHNI